MPGYVLLLAGVQALGGGLLAAKMLGVAAGGLGAWAVFTIARTAVGPHDRRRRRDAVRASGRRGSPSPASPAPTCRPRPCWPPPSRCWCATRRGAVPGAPPSGSASCWGWRRTCARWRYRWRCSRSRTGSPSGVDARRDQGGRGAHRARVRRRRAGAAAVGHPQSAALRRALSHRQPRRTHRARRRQPELGGRLLALAQSDVPAGDRLPPVRSESARGRSRRLRAGEVVGGLRAGVRDRPGRRQGRSPADPRTPAAVLAALSRERAARPAARLLRSPPAGIERLVDGFWYVLAAAAIAGARGARRRAAAGGALALLPFPLALVALYATFFSEVRYHLAIAIFMFPYAAAALVWLRARPTRARGTGARRSRSRSPSPPAGRVAGADPRRQHAARAPPLGGLRLRRRRQDHALQLARDRHRGEAPSRRCAASGTAWGLRAAGQRPDRDVSRRERDRSAARPLSRHRARRSPARRPLRACGSTPTHRTIATAAWSAGESAEALRLVEGVVDHGAGPLRLELRAQAATAPSEVARGSQPTSVWLSDIRIEPDPR